MPGPGDRRDQQRIAEQELVVGGVGRLVVRVVEQQRAQDRRARARGLLERPYRYGSSRIRSRSMARIDSYGSPNTQGSCGAVPCGSGCGRRAGRSRTRSSARPARQRRRRRTRRCRRPEAKPERPRFCSWGMLIQRCSHQDELSPVHCSACRWSPRNRSARSRRRRSGAAAKALERRPRHQRAIKIVDLGHRDGLAPARAHDVAGHRRRAGRNSAVSSISYHTPATPASTDGVCCPPHQAGAGGFVKSGNAQSPGQTTLRYSPSSRVLQ